VNGNIPLAGSGPAAHFGEDVTVHVLGEARCDWVLAVNRARHAGDGYASADMELWDVDGGRSPRLVAYATQTMLFSFPK